jgi:phage/plasmid-like protein (TIGR03299 family)
MSDEIDMSNDRANVAFVGEREAIWHRLGHQMPAGGTLEQWIAAAGFDWEAVASPLSFYPDLRVDKNGQPVYGKAVKFPGRVGIYRSDTKAPISVMSDGYKIVQPRQVMEFFRATAEKNKLTIETAGVLKGGALYWAMARMNDSFDLGKDDKLLPYACMSTSLDGSSSSLNQFTGVRVVCWNTLQAAIEGGARDAIRTPHNTVFDEKKVQTEMGMMEENWAEFRATAVALSKRKVSRIEVVQFMVDVFLTDLQRDALDPTDLTAALKKLPRVTAVLELYDRGIGQNTRSAKGTAWGALNAVTSYVDYEGKNLSEDSKLRSAWFGTGKRIKQAALKRALGLVGRKPSTAKLLAVPEPETVAGD